MGAILAFTLWQLASNIRQARRLREALPEIWRSGGAVCPHCLEPLAERPCRHGLTEGDLDTVREIWEAGIRGDLGGAARAAGLIARKSPPRGIVSRIKRVREWASISIMDPSNPLWKRLLGSIIGFGLMMSVFMLGIEWASRGVLPSPMRVVMSLVQYGVGFGGLIIAGIAWSGIGAGHNCCNACRQIIAPGREPYPCSECGADLGASGAIVSGERRRDLRAVCIGAAIGVTAMFAPIVVGSSLFERLMPVSALLLKYEFSPSSRFRISEELDRRTLDAATTARVAECMLANASTTANLLEHNGFVGDALSTGILDARFAERALRATMAIELEAPATARRGEPFLVRIVPVSGTILWLRTHVGVFTWAGLEIDGALQEAPAKWTAQSSRKPKSITIEVVLDQPGTHRLELRGYAGVAPIPVRWAPVVHR